MDLIVARLARWITEHHGRVGTLTRPATDDEIATAEQKLGVTFPEGLRALYRWTGGGEEEGPAIMHNRHLVPLDHLASTREMLAASVDDRTFVTRDWWHKAWVPFLHNGAGSHLCWDPVGSFAPIGGVAGQVLEFWAKEPDRDIVAPSFDEWLTAFVESLEAGGWAYDVETWAVDDEPSFKKLIAKRFAGYPKAPVASAIKPKVKAKPKKKAVPLPPAIPADMSRPVRDYSASAAYTIADRVSHPKFGEGVVELATEPGKITIRFGEERRVLAAARDASASDALKRPAPFDHRKTTA